MAVSIKEAHEFIRSILKKNKAGFVSPQDIDRFLNRAVSDWISAIIFKFKKTKEFNYDHLLTKRTTFTVGTSTSIQSLPADYFEGLTIYINNNGATVEGTIYNWDEFFEKENSAILKPDVDYPAATIFIDSDNGSKIQFSPAPTSGTLSYTLVYVKKPTPAVYNYTQTNGNIVFNPTGSVDLDISDRFLGDIYVRAAMYLGVTLENQVLLSTEQIKDGNQRNDER
jgi:hypothetical protein